MMQITDRDEAMLDWLSVVRMADIDAIRWALGGLAGAGTPVSMRKAQWWVARLAEHGLVDRARPTFRNGSIVWATNLAVGKSPPDLFRQTTRHEVAVAAASARYLAGGYRWTRDRKPANSLDHQADGVAIKGDIVELIEVELTPKTPARYKLICDSHALRLSRQGVARVAYLCTADAAKLVIKQADRFIFRTERAKLLTLSVFDKRGRWTGEDDALWSGEVVPGVSFSPQLSGLDGIDEVQR